MSEPAKHHVIIYTDGGCAPNPGPGGWAAILRAGEHEKELKGGEPASTNNRMELMAAISGLEALKKPCIVDMHTDSQYVRDGITKYINTWKRNGWRTASKDPVKNQDLWQRLQTARKPATAPRPLVDGDGGAHYHERADELVHEARAEVKGHAGDHYNERADELVHE